MKVLTIGLDGATWVLLDKLIDAGLMPNLKKVKEEGAYGNLESTIPPITGPAWVSFATGKNPGKHSCYDFVWPDRSLKKLRPINSKNIKGKTFYEILYYQGKKYISINLPCSTPPRTNQITIGDLLTMGDDFVFPKDVMDKVEELKKYRITPEKKYEVNGKYELYLDDIKNIEEERFRCAKKLFELFDWDYFFVLISATDWIQHIIYNRLIDEKNDNICRQALEIYRQIDSYLGWFLNNLPHETFLFIVSDHGFEKYEYQFNVNQWLCNEGFLAVQRVKDKTPAFRDEAAILKSRQGKIVFELPLFITKFSRLIELMRPLYSLITRLLPIEVNTLVEPIIEKTQAYCFVYPLSNVSGIYINDKTRFEDGVVGDDQYAKIRNTIIEKLKSLNGRLHQNIRLVKEIYTREQIYSGSSLKNAPDIIFVCGEKVKVTTSIVSKEVISRPHGAIINGHSLSGIFAVCGPGIKKAFKINGARIIDIAPTILHLFNCPIPDDVDGRILKEIFEEDSDFFKRQIVYSHESQEKERIKKKIANLKSKAKL